MAAFVTLSWWTAHRLTRAPAAWVAAAGLIVIWALALALSPIGLTTQSADLGVFLYELAFLSALVGVSLASTLLEDLRWISSRVGPERRLASRAVVLSTGGGLGVALGAVLPGALLATEHLFSADLLVRTLLGLLHLTALGVCLARAPMPGPLRLASLPTLAWLLPQAFVPESLAGRSWHALLDASRHWDPEAVSGPAALLRGLATIAALGIAAAVLEIPRLPPPDTRPATAR